MPHAPTAPLVILCAVGSAGDVHPFVGLGRELCRRGCRVTLMAAGYFRGLAEAAGLQFVDPLPELDFRSAIADPVIWDRLRGTKVVLEKMGRPLLEGLHAALLAHHDPGKTLVVASSLAFGARVAEETHGIPLVTVHLSPALFRSVHEGARLPAGWTHCGPRWWRRWQWEVIDRFLADPAVGPWLNPYRARHGLPPVRGILRDWWHAPGRVLGMFPDWFAPPQPDWPPQTRLVGFPLYSEEGVSVPESAPAAWIASGAPPIVFTPGSANVFGHGFFAAAVAACGILGRRGLLLSRFPEQVPGALPAHVRHADFLPFRWLLPRAAALVHHGGIGSASQALAAGIPQVIMPLGFDQFDNLHRVERLGVGAGLLPRQFRGPALAERLGRLLGDPAVATRCADAARRLAGADGIGRAADEVCRLLPGA
ncbi:MAG: glycosyltransferase [Planctomycetia bacterium]|nr:glycosyltransferase [Planctomycetia bacterium]